jgi:hypothetical protein
MENNNNNTNTNNENNNNNNNVSSLPQLFQDCLKDEAIVNKLDDIGRNIIFHKHQVTHFVYWVHVVGTDPHDSRNAFSIEKQAKLNINGNDVYFQEQLVNTLNQCSNALNPCYVIVAYQSGSQFMSIFTRPASWITAIGYVNEDDEYMRPVEQVDGHNNDEDSDNHNYDDNDDDDDDDDEEEERKK